jgi:hypothetical protein
MIQQQQVTVQSKVRETKQLLPVRLMEHLVLLFQQLQSLKWLDSEATLMQKHQLALITLPQNNKNYQINQ